MEQKELDKYFEFAKQFIIAQGDYVYENWKKAVVVGTEDRGNNVSTNFDKEIEYKFSEEVKKNFPEHGFLGEEHLELRRDGEYVWYIDPIDGSKWFAKGIFIWSSVITLVKDGEAILALVYNPTTKQLYHAKKGQGAFLDKKRLQVNNNAKLEDSQIAYDFPVSEKMVAEHKKSWEGDQEDMHPVIKGKTWEEYADSQHKGLSKLYKEAYRVRDIGAGPYAMALIAQGFFNGFVAPCQHDSKIVDHLGPAFIAKEAGAIVEITPLNEHLNYIVIGANQGIIKRIKEIFGY